MDTRDLWPKDIGEATLVAPSAILKEQASMLGEKTKYLVTAEVVTKSEGSTLIHTFQIKAPALDNYTYQLFSVHHGINFYPLSVVFEGSGYGISTQEEFIVRLSDILGSATTRNLVKSLIAQVG